MKILKISRLVITAGWLLALMLLHIVTLSGAQGAQPPDPNAPPRTELNVINPTSGARLYTLIYFPTESAPEERFPLLVLIPGGSAAGSASFLPPQAQRYADLGFLVVVFDADGRGQSTGIENDNGFIHQDGLAAVIERANALPQSDGRVVLLSQSYGVTMASGAMARYPELPFAFYVDWEGPANRDDTGGCDGAGLGHLQDHNCNDEGFWSEREASTFISQIDVPYQRVQSERDHVQPDNAHALLMINNATSQIYGGNGRAPWTRLNDEAPNQFYQSEIGIDWAPENLSVPSLLMSYLEEFLAEEIP